MSETPSNKEKNQQKDGSEIENVIKTIIEICEKIPEPYRKSCFEILLNAKLRGIKPTPQKIEEVHEENLDTKQERGFEIPIDVRAFLSQFGLDENHIKKLFLIDNKEIRQKFNISTTKKSKAQIQIALLLALENSIKNPNTKFEFASEEVRQRCRDHGVYDPPNFTTHFKNNQKLFKSLEDLEKISLSPEGKSELADTISQISNG